MKTCATCKQAKHESEFGKQKQKHDGLRCYCKSCDNERRRKWSEANKERQRNIQARAYAKPERREYARAYRKNLRDTNPTFKYRDNLSRRINTALERKCMGPKTKNLPDIIGCSIDDLGTHLILSAINRYGYWLENEAYHIDHIVPLASANGIDDINRLNHYTNLQLLTPQDNQAKGCK